MIKYKVLFDIMDGTDFSKHYDTEDYEEITAILRDINANRLIMLNEYKYMDGSKEIIYINPKHITAIKVLTFNK